MKKGLVFLGFVFLLSLSFPLFAYWSEPVALSELNDFDEGTVASSGSFTEDQLYVCFFRNGRLWQSQREGVEDLFEPASPLNEIYNGYYTSGGWLSGDGLRLYYEQIVFTYNGFQRYIKMASRESLDAPWSFVRTLGELHSSFNESVDTAPSLSHDELTIYWASNRYGNLQERKVYVADRPDVNEPFGNIREADEFNAVGASVPHLSADGLTAYTAISGENGLAGLWKATRSTLGEPFGNFEPMDEINQWGVFTASPWVSADQKTIYFTQRQGEPEDITAKGIYVSYWIENPYDVAVENLTEAAALKQEALALLEAAALSEREAMTALFQAMTDDIPDPLSPMELRKCRIEVIQALIKQFQANLHLRQSARILERLLERMLPPVIEEAAAVEQTPRPYLEVTVDLSRKPLERTAKK